MAAPTTITVFDNIYDDSGKPVVGITVTCVLDSTVETTSGGLITALTQSTTTDANGKFTFTLIPNDLLTPANSTYTIYIRDIGRSYQIQPLSTNGNSQQTTAGNVIVNAPQTLSAGVITGIITTQDDLIVGGVGGVPTRLAKGADGQVLTVDTGTHHVQWDASPAGFSNPMTNAGDLITGGTGGAAQRLGVGALAKYLRSDGSNPSWQTITEGDVQNLTTDLAAKATGQSLTFKNAVKVATQSNQASLSGTPTIDGYATVAGDRILLKSQTTASQNGIWVVAAGAWTRPADFTTGSDAQGNAVLVEGGNTNAGQVWAISSPATPVAVIVDTNNQTWAQVSGGGGGLVIDQTPGDYNAIGASLVLGSTGKTIDAGTSLAHGSGYLPNAHHNQAHADSDHTGANRFNTGLVAGINTVFSPSPTPRTGIGLRTDTSIYPLTNDDSANSIVDVGFQENTWAPEDYSFLSWAFDPAAPAGAFALAVAGTVYVIRLHLRKAVTVTNIIIQITTAGSGLTAGQCFAGLFDSSKNLKSATADQAAAWASTGTITMALTAAQAMSAADCYVGLFFNGTTGPTIVRGNNTGAINATLSAANSRWATADTGRTTSFPATLGAFTALNNSLWTALS